MAMTLSGTANGRVRVGVSRDATHGEDNCPVVANLVVILLNEWGEGWSNLRTPDGSEDGADMIADGPRGRLRLQITRVPRSPEHWEALSVTGHAARTVAPDELADEMIDAIRHKVARYSPQVRATTMLILDGQNAIGFDLPGVLHSFTRRHITEALASGFDDVFLLGTFRFINLLRPQQDSTWFSVA
ncbi:MAG TPA: hypothetical protein VE967_10220 [Gemmatimonadaceae bacterium]|nr:hypothetical protein [Gemmatimonadaceae bacterium]